MSTLWESDKIAQVLGAMSKWEDCLSRYEKWTGARVCRVGGSCGSGVGFGRWGGTGQGEWMFFKVTTDRKQPSYCVPSSRLRPSGCLAAMCSLKIDAGKAAPSNAYRISDVLTEEPGPPKQGPLAATMWTWAGRHQQTQRATVDSHSLSRAPSD